MSDVAAGRYSRRRGKNAVMLTLCWTATGLGLGALVFILAALLINGLGSIDLRTFYLATPPMGEEGGLANVIVGSLMITGIGIAIGTPIGILAGTYMAEYGRHTRLTAVVRFVNDILLSAPSIIIGLFIYGAVVVPMGGATGLAGGLALAVIAVPVVVRTTEDMLLLVPNPLREAASALGMPRAHVVLKVAYRAALTGIITGVLLAIARISGETAPLLFSTGNNLSWNLNPVHNPMGNLPVSIYNFYNNPGPESKRLAWAGALVITLTVLLLNVVARTVGRTRVKV